jgi:DNA invertase Pin-like site-specific DNA recombinase
VACTMLLMSVFAENEAKLISARMKEELAAAKMRDVTFRNPNLDKVRNTKTEELMSFYFISLKSLNKYIIIMVFFHPENVADALNVRGVKTRRGCRWSRILVGRLQDRVFKLRGE